MLHKMTHLWVMSLICLISAFSTHTDSISRSNTTSHPSFPSTVGRNVSSRTDVSSILRTANSSTIHTSVGTSPLGTVPASTSNKSFSSQSSLASSSSHSISKRNTATATGSLSKSFSSSYSISKSNTATATGSLSKFFSSSHSISKSNTASISSSLSKSLSSSHSISKSNTASISSSLSKSLSSSHSISKSNTASISGSLSKSLSSSYSISKSNTATATGSLSKSLSSSHSISKSNTASISSSLLKSLSSSHSISKSNTASISGSLVKSLLSSHSISKRNIATISGSMLKSLLSSYSISKNNTATATGSLSKSLSSSSSTVSQSSTRSQPTSSRSSSSSLKSSSSTRVTGPIITTTTTGGSTQILTLPPASITPPPTLSINWGTVIPTSKSGVSSATHDSHGWPIIPSLHCWFCPPSGGGGGIGFLIPGITGPGILPPPPPGVKPPPGFSSNMPAITLNSAGDPTYDSEEPTSQPTESASSTKSSSSSCTSTTTGYDLFVTCTTMTQSHSASCVTSTRTTTGCLGHVTTTTSTTIVDSCPLNAQSSISAEYLSARQAAQTVVSGTTYPLAFYPTEVSVSSSTNISTFARSSGRSVSRTSSGSSTFTTSTTRQLSSSFATPSITAPPMPKCTLQNEDPDQGINARGCICGSTTLPLLTITPEVDESLSCSYTAIPSKSTPKPISIESQTYSSNCQACTLVGGIADTPKCTSVKGCTPTTLPTPTKTTSAAPTGPTGFHLVGLRCSASDCTDTLEIVPSAQDSCSTIAQNQEAWWGGAFPHPAEQMTEFRGNQIAPFSVLKDSNDFDLLYVFGPNFSADLCGLPKLNFTFTQTSGAQWTWLDTDNNSGTCYDNTRSQASTCSHNDLTYTAQELLVCVQPKNPSYCASVSV